MALAHSPRIVRDGLVLYLDAANIKSYPGSGTTWTDISTNNHHATLTNGPTFNSGNGGYFVFDGINDHARIDASFQVSTSATYSFEAWIFKTSTGTSNAAQLISGGFGGDQDGLTISSETFSTAGDARIQTTNGTCTAVYYNSVSQNLTESGNATLANFNLNEWIHIAVTGLSVDSVDGGRHHIGQNNNNTNEYTGRISNIKIYDRELTALEVKQNYNALKGRFGL